MDSFEVNRLPMPEQPCTVEQYLEFERASEERHEYLNGYIHLLESSNHNHSLIEGNISGALYQQLRKTRCLLFLVAMRLHITRTGLYTYPDICVVCDTPQYLHDDTLLNPVLIAEVMSPTSEGHDRVNKFKHYRALESLQECMLVDQRSARLEHYARQPDGQWLLSDYTGLEAVLTLPSIGCTLALSDVYEKVRFEEDSE